MMVLRPSEERGIADYGWLKSYHTFSFADYHDPKHTRFRKLRVINEDWVEAGQGFAPHSHQDMEIITYVLEGALKHEDSMGNTSVIRPGEVQRMSAGTGVTHSEYNASQKTLVHLLQIWIFPERSGLPPGYEQKVFGSEGKKNKLRLIVSPDGREGSVTAHQNGLIYDASLDAGETIRHAVDKKRGQWIQVTKGMLKIGGKSLKPGDGAAMEDETLLLFETNSGAEFILFDLA